MEAKTSADAADRPVRYRVNLQLQSAVDLDHVTLLEKPAPQKSAATRPGLVAQAARPNEFGQGR